MKATLMFGRIGSYGMLVLVTGMSLLAPSPAYAALSIAVGNHLLQSNQPGQMVDFFVTGADAVTGLEFDIQIGRNVAGPTIMDVDLKTDTIFSNAAFLEADTVQNPRQAQSLATSTGTGVLADGKIATVTFDTTGIPAGTYNLDLTGVAGSFDTTFFNGANQIPTQITNGTITVVAEPSAAVLIGLSAIGVLFGTRKRRKSRACAPVK